MWSTISTLKKLLNYIIQLNTTCYKSVDNNITQHCCSVKYHSVKRYLIIIFSTIRYVMELSTLKSQTYFIIQHSYTKLENTIYHKLNTTQHTHKSNTIQPYSL